MNERKEDKVITISPEEQEARLLSSVILEYNDESQYLARDDRENLITFGDGQGNRFPIPFPEGEKALWKQMRRFRNLIVHGFKRFADDGSVTIHPSERWKTNVREADIEPFPNGLVVYPTNTMTYISLLCEGPACILLSKGGGHGRQKPIHRRVVSGGAEVPPSGGRQVFVTVSRRHSRQDRPVRRARPYQRTDRRSGGPATPDRLQVAKAVPRTTAGRFGRAIPHRTPPGLFPPEWWWRSKR